MRNTSLIDTNILVYAYNTDSFFHDKAFEVLQNALDGSLNCAIADKNLYEFYAIITDQRRVEKPVSIKEAYNTINLILDSKIRLLFPTSSTILSSLKLA